MRKTMATACFAAALCAALGGALRAARAGDTPPRRLERLQVNRWAKLPSRGNGHWGNPMVYAGSRRQVLHYVGWTVKAFDADQVEWSDDYAWPHKRGEGFASIHNNSKGVTYKGTGQMLPGPVPAPAMTINGACWDPKRKQLILTMKGLMAAYDPVTRTWRDLKAKTIIAGKEYAGGPPLYGTGVCYDPVNDEIVMFPHWSGRGDPKNMDRVDVTGQVSGHLGTFVYSFTDNTWRRTSHTFGSSEVRKARRAVIALMSTVSTILDEAWVLRSRPEATKAVDVARRLAVAADEATKMTLPADAQAVLAKAVGPLRSAAEHGAAGRMAEALATGSEALRALEAALDHPLRVEPPPRCGAALVYDPKHKVMVLFGGQTGLIRTDLRTAAHYGGRPGGLNDTWLYDVVTRQWREAPCRQRPPVTLWPDVVYDPNSGLTLLLTFASGGRRTPATVTLWSFDAAVGEWAKRLEQPWPGTLARQGWYGWSNWVHTVGFDPGRDLLLLVQGVRQGRTTTAETYAMRLDVAALPSHPAPAWTPPKPIRPQVIPPEDPAWVAKLKSLPANTWVPAKPRPRTPSDRGWGTATCDPVRGHVYYFGGGHATYQVNDVAIYAVGANTWVHGAGDHNDFVPPVGWGGIAMTFRGGKCAHHQRNTYSAVAGRMYVSHGTGSRRWGAQEEKRPGPRYAWFYDLDRGGVWRWKRIAKVTMGPGVPGTYGVPHLTTPDGRVIGFGGGLEPYDGRFFPKEVYASEYDIAANTLTLKKVPAPHPEPVLECRPFCVIPDRNQVFFCEARGTRRATWVYDLQANRFTNLHAKNQPVGEPRTVLYLDGQDAVFALIGKACEQWVYSFKHNAWAPLPLRLSGEGTIRFARPYAQTVYVAKYGILVNLPRTEIMRPDAGAVDWQSVENVGRPPPAKRFWPFGPHACVNPAGAYLNGSSPESEPGLGW